MSQDVTQPIANNSIATDEIDLVDLVKNIWRQRGLVIGFMLAAILAVLVFHISKGTFSSPSRIDYPVSLPFLLDDKTHYPNGMAFSARDISASNILLKAITDTGVALSAEGLESALTISPSNSLLAKGEQQLAALLSNAKTPVEIKAAAETALEDLQQAGLGFITLSLNLSSLSLTHAQGSELLQSIIQAWADYSIERGLMNVDIQRPLQAFSVSESSNLIDNYDLASNYLNSLEKAVTQLAELSGSASIVMDGMSLEDIKSHVLALKDRDIGPLREFAYSNSTALAKSDAAIQVRLFARQRLLDLEHDRLSKLITSYDAALEQLGTDNSQFNSNKANSKSQGGVSQFDQSFLDSILKLGTRLGGVDTRKDLFERRITAVEELLNLEKEIAILLGTSSNKKLKINPELILKDALTKIEMDLNQIQQHIDQFIDTIRDLTIQSHTPVYVASSAPQVRGGIMKLAPRFALFIVLGGILGLFLGIFVALTRSALFNSNK